MMVTLSRIIKYSWQNFIRNGLLSTSTISIMFLTLTVFEGLLFFNVMAKKTVNALEEKIDISVYFKSNVAEDSVLNIQRTLEDLAEVKHVEYISQDQALKIFKDKHVADEAITQTLTELESNPLLASLNVKAEDPKEYKTIASYLNSPKLKDFVEKVSFAQNEVVINRLASISQAFKKGGFILTSFLAFLAIVITFNTIRLAIYSNSEQISIMRLVGASNHFVRGPYVLEGIIYGFVGALASFLVFIPIVHYASPYVSNFASDINLQNYLNDNFFSILGYQLLFGVSLGVISSFMAIRRYLKI